MKRRLSPVMIGGKQGEYGVLKRRKYTFINKTGKQLIPFKYAYLEPFNEGIAVVNIGANWIYMDMPRVVNGVILIKPEKRSPR